MKTTESKINKVIGMLLQASVHPQLVTDIIEELFPWEGTLGLNGKFEPYTHVMVKGNIYDIDHGISGGTTHDVMYLTHREYLSIRNVCPEYRDEAVEELMRLKTKVLNPSDTVITVGIISLIKQNMADKK